MFHRDNCTVHMCIVGPLVGPLCNPPGSPPPLHRVSPSLKQDEYNHFLHSNYLLQFLWLATCGDVELPVRSSVLAHPKLDKIFNDCLESLLPRGPPQLTNTNNSLVTATSRLTAVNKDLSLVTQQAANKPQGWDSLMS